MEESPLKKLYHRVRGAVSRQRSIPCGLCIVRDPRDADIDIVAVHGLGQGFESWVTSAKGKSKPWLEELLATDIPTARIMTYVYPSEGVNYRYLVRNILYGRALDLVKELASRRGRDGTARRPLFFIAHSLGGWIVKRALILSSEATDALKDLELSTCGIVFFGTPSPGRPSAPSPLAHVIRTTTARSLDAAASAGGMLQPQVSDTAWLENQMEAFKAITATVPHISFHETKREDGRFVVEKRHSMSGSDGERIGLTATHFDLIRFGGRDENYRAFIGRFRAMMDPVRMAELVRSKREMHERASEARLHDYLGGGFDGIPYRLPGRAGVLRRDLLEQIENALEPPVDQERVPLHLGIAIILGEAGTGKTTVARQYADMRQDDFSFVFWIHGESWETVIASFLDFAGRLVEHHAKTMPRDQVESDLGLEGVGEMLKARGVRQLDAFRVRGVVRAVKDWLMRSGNDRWLLVFDNVEPSLDIVEFIPLRLTGRIILTCREAGSCTWGTNIFAEEMREDEAVEMLKTVSYAAPGYDGEEEEEAEAEAALRLVRRLGYHVQSIALAGDAIRKRGLTIGKYEAELPIPWSLGFMNQFPAAKTVLHVSAMLSGSAIPAALFSKAGLQTALGVDNLQATLEFLLQQNLIQTSPQMSRMNSFSSDGSSCTTTSSSIESFTMHPAARGHLRGTLTPAERTENALLACNMCVRGIRDNETTSSSLPEIQDFGRVMAPHAKTCYDDWSQILRDVDNKGVGDVAWHVLGNVCMTQGLSEQAKGCFELSLRHAKMTPAERIQTSLSLACLLQQSGETEKAAETLAGTDPVCNDKTLGFRVALAKASAAAARGELSQAEDEYGLLKHEQEESLGVTDATTMETVRRLAATVELQGRLEEAQALRRRVHMTRRMTLGQGHPMTVEALDELARVCREGNAVDEAEELYRRSVEVKTRALGGGHWRTAQALQRLAVMDDVRCRYVEARGKYRVALGVMVGVLGGGHPLCTTTMENLALSRRLHGRLLGERRIDEEGGDNKEEKEEMTRDGAFAEAEQIYLEVMRIKRAAGMVYTEKQVLETGSKLREMYENEEYYIEVRENKVEGLMGVLRARRRGTV